jgi:hypothetical protein
MWFSFPYHLSNRGNTIRKSAWYIRRLISVWKRWAKRGTCPRNTGQKLLFEAAGIPWPERPSDFAFAAPILYLYIYMCVRKYIYIYIHFFIQATCERTPRDPVSHLRVCFFNLQQRYNHNWWRSLGGGFWGGRVGRWPSAGLTSVNKPFLSPHPTC